MQRADHRTQRQVLGECYLLGGVDVLLLKFDRCDGWLGIFVCGNEGDRNVLSGLGGEDGAADFKPIDDGLAIDGGQASLPAGILPAAGVFGRVLSDDQMHVRRSPRAIPRPMRPPLLGMRYGAQILDQSRFG